MYPPPPLLALPICCIPPSLAIRSRSVDDIEAKALPRRESEEGEKCLPAESGELRDELRCVLFVLLSASCSPDMLLALPDLASHSRTLPFLGLGFRV